jgi:hypothetical protein
MRDNACFRQQWSSCSLWINSKEKEREALMKPSEMANSTTLIRKLKGY